MTSIPGGFAYAEAPWEKPGCWPPASHREPVDHTPVWFMRQAGRCLAGYRRLRERYGILEITRTPELCAQVTTMPVDTFGVDGAVLYADIMLPLYGMGVPFSIDPGIGPIVHQPVRDAAAVEALRVVEAEEATPSCSRPSACSAGTWAAAPP